jgi:antiviral helicase SLH1
MAQVSFPERINLIIASYRVQVGMRLKPAHPRFIPGMVDSLNAEIALGTITNVAEAIQWLGYTYLFGE